MKTIFILAAVLLMGCDFKVGGPMIKKAEKICKLQGGIEYIHLLWADTEAVKCNYGLYAHIGETPEQKVITPLTAEELKQFE